MPIMSHSEWKRRTKLGVLKPRSSLLKKVDNCLNEYDQKRGDPRLFEALCVALGEWIKSKDNVEDSARNFEGAVTDLIRQVEDFKKQNINPASHLMAMNHLEEIRKGAELFKQGKLKPAKITVPISTGVVDKSAGHVVYEGFTQVQLPIAKNAWAEAYRAAGLAVAGAAKAGTDNTEKTRLTTWLGPTSVTTKLQTVKDNLNAMLQAFQKNKVTLSLREDKTLHYVNGDDPFGDMVEGFNTSTVYGFVWSPSWGHVGSGYRVILGNVFLRDRTPHEDAQTIYHELTHKVLKTKDHAYGKEKCKLLVSTPANALTNADSFAYYAVSFLA